jgi:hypothetical protein
MNEMSESTSIVNQVVNNVTNLKNNVGTKDRDSNVLPHLILNSLCNDEYSKKKLHPEKTQMEEVINDFKK